jgi:hypothetical protein
MPQSPREHAAAFMAPPRDRAGSSASFASSSVLSRLAAGGGGHTRERRTGAREDAALRLAAVLATQQLLVSSLETRQEELTARLVAVNAQLTAVQQPATRGGGAAHQCTSLREQQAFMAEVRARAAAAQKQLDAAMHAEAHHDAGGYAAAGMKQAGMSAGAAPSSKLAGMLQRHARSVARSRLAVDTARRHALAGGDSRASLLAAQARAVLAEKQEAAKREEAAVLRQGRAQRRPSLLAKHNLGSGDQASQQARWNVAAAAAVLVGLGGAGQ